MLCFNRRLGCLAGTANLHFVEDLGIFFRGLAESNHNSQAYKYFQTPFYKKFEKSADNMYKWVATGFRVYKRFLILRGKYWM